MANGTTQTGSDPTYLDILDQVLVSFDGWRTFAGDGTAHLGWIQAPEDQTPDWEFTKYDLAGPYERVPSGDPPREIEVEWGHVGYPEPRSQLSEEALPNDAGFWERPFRVEKRPIPNADTVYKLANPQPLHVPARWSTAEGGRTECQRLVDRVARREGCRFELAGNRWVYSAVKPGDYFSIQAQRVPGGTATGVIWSTRVPLDRDVLEITGWGILAE